MDRDTMWAGGIYALRGWRRRQTTYVLEVAMPQVAPQKPLPISLPFALPRWNFRCLAQISNCNINNALKS